MPKKTLYWHYICYVYYKCDLLENQIILRCDCDLHSEEWIVYQKRTSTVIEQLCFLRNRNSEFRKIVIFRGPFNKPLAGSSYSARSLPVAICQRHLLVMYRHATKYVKLWRSKSNNIKTILIRLVTFILKGVDDIFEKWIFLLKGRNICAKCLSTDLWFTELGYCT